MSRAIVPQSLREAVPKLYKEKAIRVKNLEELATWFVEVPERMYYLSEYGNAAQLAVELGCDEEFARLMLRDRELYRAVMERMLISKANPARMARIYDKLLARLENMDEGKDSLKDVVQALDFVEKRMGNHPTLILKGEIEHRHTHKMIGIVYASKVPPQLLEEAAADASTAIIEAEALPAGGGEGIAADDGLSAERG